MLISQQADYYFDGPNKRYAMNISTYDMDNQPSTEQIYQILDFVKVLSLFTFIL